MLRIAFAIVLAIGPLSSASAFRTFEQPEAALELSLADVRLPSGVTGPVTFTTCEACPITSRQLTPSTKIFIDGRQIAYADFLVITTDLRSAAHAQPVLLTLFVDNETLRVTRISMHTPPQVPVAAASR